MFKFLLHCLNAHLNLSQNQRYLTQCLLHIMNQSHDYFKFSLLLNIDMFSFYYQSVSLVRNNFRRTLHEQMTIKIMLQVLNKLKIAF